MSEKNNGWCEVYGGFVNSADMVARMTGYLKIGAAVSKESLDSTGASVFFLREDVLAAYKKARGARRVCLDVLLRQGILSPSDLPERVIVRI